MKRENKQKEGSAQNKANYSDFKLRAARGALRRNPANDISLSVPSARCCNVVNKYTSSAVHAYTCIFVTGIDSNASLQSTLNHCQRKESEIMSSAADEIATRLYTMAGSGSVGPKSAGVGPPQ